MAGPLIVTGLSGAGMSSALKNLEDFGFEVFDNFPLTLVEPLLKDGQGKNPLVAIGIDIRTRGFDSDLILRTAEQPGATLLFLNCDENILIKRFTETRRRHPLAADRPATAGIKREQELLAPLKDRADLVIDTTGLSVHDLRRILEGHYSPEDKKLTISLMSFGFRHGLPREADMVMDIRFLKNPYWEAELRLLTGRDAAIGDYIRQDEHFGPFVESFKRLVEPLLPCYAEEGKSYLTMAIGCTGGRHRSVYTVETLKPWLEDQGFKTHVFHRDLPD